MNLLDLITKNIGINGTVLLKHSTNANGSVKTTFSITIDSEDYEENKERINKALVLSVQNHYSVGEVKEYEIHKVGTIQQLQKELKMQSEKKKEEKTPIVTEKAPVQKDLLAKYESDGDAAFAEKRYEAAINYYAAAIEIKESKKLLAKLETAQKWLKATSALTENLQPKEPEVVTITAAEVVETKPEAGLHRTLSIEQIADFKAWARENYQAGSLISELWHPVVREECEIMNAEFDEEVPTVQGAVGMEGLPQERLDGTVGDKPMGDGDFLPQPFKF